MSGLLSRLVSYSFQRFYLKQQSVKKSIQRRGHPIPQTRCLTRCNISDETKHNSRCIHARRGNGIQPSVSPARDQPMIVPLLLYTPNRSRPSKAPEPTLRVHVLEADCRGAAASRPLDPPPPSFSTPPLGAAAPKPVLLVAVFAFGFECCFTVTPARSGGRVRAIPGAPCGAGAAPPDASASPKFPGGSPRAPAG